MKRIHSNTALLGAALLVAACGSTEPDGAQVSLTLASGITPAASIAGGSSLRGSETYNDGQSTLILTKVEVVLREIELKPVEVVDCDVIPEPAECEDFEVGPVLVDVPLGGVSRIFVILVEPGSYDEIEFEFHKVSGDAPSDAAIRNTDSDMIDKSIRATGTFNGQPFTYESDLNVEQEFDLAPPMVIDGETLNTNLTLRVGLSDWFRDQGGMLVDPNEGNKGGQYEGIIKENIKQSIEAFEDRDGDGDDLDEF